MQLAQVTKKNDNCKIDLTPYYAIILKNKFRTRKWSSMAFHFIDNLKACCLRLDHDHVISIKYKIPHSDSISPENGRRLN